jgi:hypothetical protein
MNDHGAYDDYETDYADGYSAARAFFLAKLAGVLTDARRNVTKTDAYRRALDDIAKAMDLKIATEVRYTA